MINITALPREIISAVFAIIEAQLPPERTRLHAIYLGKAQPSFGKYAVICKAWQPIIEARVFRTLRLDSADIPEATNILRPRRHFIRKVELIIRLSRSPDEDSSALYRHAIHELFANFAEDPVPPAHVHSASLKFHISLVVSSRGLELVPDVDELWSDSAIVTPNLLAYFENIPEIPRVDELHMKSTLLAGHLELPAWCRISSRLPNLRICQLAIVPGVRSSQSQSDNDFSDSIGLLPAGIESFKLIYTKTPGENGYNDTLSQQLRDLAMRPAMRVFEISCPVEPSLFLFGTEVEFSDTVSELREFVVFTNPVTPSGAQLLLPEPPDFVPKHRDVRTIRELERAGPALSASHVSVVNEDVMNPLLIRAAAMARSMPRLQRLSICLQRRYTFKLSYKHGLLSVHNHHSYVPSPDVLRAWLLATTTNRGQNETLSVMITSSGHQMPIFKLGATSFSP